MRRDWTNHGRVSPTAKYVNGRWQQLAHGDGHYQPLRERLGPFRAAIIELADADQLRNTHAAAASGGTTAGYPRISGLPNLAT